MKNIIGRFYLFGVILVSVVVIGLFFQFVYNRNLIVNEIHKGTNLTCELVKSEVEKNLYIKSQIISDICDYIVNKDFEKEELLKYLKELMNNNSDFASIYYSSAENEMINGSGWIPPSNFDARTRPWHKKAVDEKKLIFTEAFINATKDKMIITIAKPVIDENNKLIGVVGGDLSISNIKEIVNKKETKNNTYSFLIDSKGNILAHPHHEYNLNAKLINIMELTDGVFNKNNDKSGTMEIKLDNKKGYLVFQSIEKTDWIVGTFIPKEEYTKGSEQLLLIFIITLISSIFLLLILFIIEKKCVLSPLIKLDEDIQQIDIENMIDYRVPEKDNDQFFVLRKSINSILDKTEEYFKQLRYNEDNLRDQNIKIQESLNTIMKVEEELRRSEMHNEAIINAIPDILFIVNSSGFYVDCKTRDEENLILPRNMLINRSIKETLPEDIAEIAYQKIQDTIKQDKLQSFEYSLDLNNEIQNFEARMLKCSDDEVVIIIRNITEQKIIEMQLENLSYRDQLTGLYNRRFFEEEIRRLDVQRNLPISIIIADVNGLKLANDAFGHKMGDRLLKTAADVIRDSCRIDDIIARWGGDEFIVLLPKTSYNEAEEIAKRIKEGTELVNIDSIPLSISLGWETRNNLEGKMEEVFKKAEDYMYRRKLFESPSMRGKTIKIVMKTLHERNKREEQHSQRVGELCKKIGLKLGLNNIEVNELMAAGMLHDIGKIAIDDTILNKADVLQETEWSEIKRHSEIGYRILSSSNDTSEIAEYVLAHHERWDGKGYPKGIKGEEIPLYSRIIAVADAYDAMTRDRTYRKAMTHEIAVKELIQNSGTQFDADIVRIFIEKEVQLN